MNATHSIAFIALALVIVGCSGTQSSTSSEPAPAENAEVSAEEVPATSGDIHMSFYEYGPTAGDQNLPSFAVRAADSTQGADNVVSFVDAEATIFTEDGVNIVITAGGATMDQETQQAAMMGGAHIQRGQMSIALEDLQWNNEKQE